MKSFTVSDLMVPISEYATVVALEKAQEEFDQTRYRHRAILVFDKDEKIVGKISQLDILKALEPKYKELMTEGATRHLGFSTKYLQGMLEQFSLWAGPLTDICRKGVDRRAKDFAVAPTPGEYVNEGDSLDIAIHQLIVGNHQSLLVKNTQDEIVGILRLTDVFAAVFHKLKECKIDV